MVDGVSRTEIRPGADAPAPPVVLGDEDGELLSIDLRDDVALVEYTRTTDRRWSVLLLLVALNALDVITTVAVISAGGSENNPLMRPFVEAVWPAVALKAAVLITIAWLLARCEDSRRIEMMMVFATGWYLAVVSWNLTVLALA
jgi:hypothetical protein